MGAAVVRGRCLPYGEGITYWPVVGVLKQLDVRPLDDAAAAAIRSLLGESDAATSAEEIAWAFRKTLEQCGRGTTAGRRLRRHPVGRGDFLDLIEHVALLSSGAAILLLCIARPELTERHPTWPVTLRLEPLRDDDVDELIPKRIAGQLRAEDRSRRRAATRSSSGRCWLWPARSTGTSSCPAHPAGAARRAPRPARAGRAERARARRDRGRDLPPRRRPGSHAG